MTRGALSAVRQDAWCWSRSGRCRDDRATTPALAVLVEHCAALGRDPAEIEKTVSSRLGDGESAERFAQRFGRWTGWASSTRSCCAPDRGTAAGLATLAAARPLLDRADRAG